MNPRDLVRPLEPEWQAVLDEVLRPLRRSTKNVSELATSLKELSQAYNTGVAEGRKTKLPLDARIAFSFPRDVPKGAAAVRELVALGMLSIPEDRPLRIMDIGAGLGAMTWGVVRALQAAKGTKPGRIEAVLLDEDAEVLSKADAIARAAQAGLFKRPIEVSISARVESLAKTAARTADSAEARFDVVILGQVLSEIDPKATPEERLEKQAHLIGQLVDHHLADEGSLVIVEPALRDRTRHLHALRDRVLAQQAGAALHVFAPCLHQANCPALLVEDEWCHEDLAEVSLPPWVTPLAQAAGLRWQGLTFSYLVLRRGRARDVAGADAFRFRIISNVIRTKGKVELFICDERGQRQRIRRLDRDERVNSDKADAAPPVAFTELERGDVVALRPVGTEKEGDAIDERGRVGPNTHATIDVGSLRK